MDFKILLFVAYYLGSSLALPNKQVLSDLNLDAVADQLNTITAQANRQVHPDFNLDAKQFIKKYEYPMETHTIRTVDGYILETHRIPHGKANADDGPKQAVLLFPGVLCSSDIWVNTGENSLAFILADEGFDVWLANYRGTTWSRKHASLDPVVDEEDFFNYSFEEISAFDVTANIDYILKITKQQKLFYIGHSQGTTVYFAMASSKPEYNDKIHMMTALAPVAYITHIDNILFNIMKRYYSTFESLVKKFKLYGILKHSPLITIIVQVFCNDESFYQPICGEMIYFISGQSKNFDESLIPVIARNTPGGASARMLLHYLQVGIKDSFDHYDFGEKINMEKYGQTTPPKYELDKITSPVLMYYSDKDNFSTVKDVERLNSELSNVVENHFIDSYSHLDYLWAGNVKSQVYDDMIAKMKNHIPVTNDY